MGSDESNIFDAPEVVFQTVKEKKEKPSYRKLEDDSIRKKFKTHCEESLRRIVNKHIESLFPNKGLAFKKLPQNFLSCAKIEVNQIGLEMTIAKRYCYDFIEETGHKLSYAAFQKLQTNREVVRKLKEELKYKVDNDKVLGRQVKDLVMDFINSKKYKAELEIIERSEGIDYKKKYDKVIRGNDYNLSYVDYYIKSSGNKTKVDQ